MHPVLAKLGSTRRCELFANPHFAGLLEPRRTELFDAVLKVRGVLDELDEFAVFSDPDKLMADAEELKLGLTSVLAVLDPQHVIGSDMIGGLARRYGGSFHDAFLEKRACIETLRRMLAVVEDLNAKRNWAPRSRTEREAVSLRWVLSQLGIKVSMTTPGASLNYGLGLMGLLADPPTTGEAMRKRLQRRRLRR